jgi:hypothetical protein
MARQKPSGPVRYRKTEHRFLEDFVLLLRVAGELALDPDQVSGGKAKQTYSAAELLDWQAHRLNRDGQPKRFDHLEPAALAAEFPGTDGRLTDALIQQILAYQEPDHQRILAVQRDGVWRYGAHQGLHEEMVYTELVPCPPELTIAMHLTKVPTARALLAGTPTENNKTRYKLRADPAFDILPGHLVPLGRYIHAFGWFALDGDELTAMDAHWPLRARLFRRFRDRLGFGIDMAALRQHYADRGVPWSAVCGLNAVGTVIFLRPVPPQTFIARGRARGATTGGEAYTMVTLWRVTDADLAAGRVR